MKCKYDGCGIDLGTNDYDYCLAHLCKRCHKRPRAEGNDKCEHDIKLIKNANEKLKMKREENRKKKVEEQEKLKDSYEKLKKAYKELKAKYDLINSNKNVEDTNMFHYSDYAKQEQQKKHDELDKVIDSVTVKKKMHMLILCLIDIVINHAIN